MNVSRACKAEAFQSNKPRKLSVKETVLKWYERRCTTGAIPEQCVKDLNFIYSLKQNSVAPRITDLLKIGELVETGETRLTTSNCPAAVLVHKDYAAEVLNNQQQSLFGMVPA